MSVTGPCRHEFQPFWRCSVARTAKIENGDRGTKVNTRNLEPPEDRLFQHLMLQAAQEELDVYGAVIETAQVEFKRTHG